MKIVSWVGLFAITTRQKRSVAFSSIFVVDQVAVCVFGTKSGTVFGAWMWVPPRDNYEDIFDSWGADLLEALPFSSLKLSAC